MNLSSTFYSYYSVLNITNARRIQNFSTPRGHEQLCHVKLEVVTCGRELLPRFCLNSKAGGIMAHRDFSPEELHELRRLAAQWGKIVSRRAFGDDGPGLDVEDRKSTRLNSSHTVIS